jgi:hypothetical protein
VQLLHLSDPHLQDEVCKRLNELAIRLASIDAVVVTGDIVTRARDVAPREWNDWPQPSKLAVRGNHDGPWTLVPLIDWTWRAPWARWCDNVTFIGLDTAFGFDSVPQQLERLPAPEVSTGVALVVSSHRWPQTPDERQLASPLARIAAGRPVLFLHGHDHQDFCGTFWDADAAIGSLRCCRSHVCSCVSATRGLGHLISFDDGGFTYERVQGRLLAVP